jgi:triosephosphate isomerase
MKFAIANWKMNLPPEGIDGYMRAMSGAQREHAAIVVAPPFPFLRDVAKQASNGVEVAAQNASDHDKGAFTGEVAPAMIRYCGVRYVILGHSERRSLYGETDSLIARKLAVAMETGLTPVLCIGEDLRVRDAGQAAVHLSEQVHAVASAVGSGPIVVAYEPIWAIGTGRNASGALCAETVAEVRHAIERFWTRGDVPLLYGGSVTPENVEDLVTNGAIDGFLVGGASLDSAKFLAIYNALGRT